MCDCRQRIEGLVKEGFAKNLSPDCKNLGVRLDGYALALGHAAASSRMYMRANVSYQKPSKNNVLKNKKDCVNIVASFCMFCGEKYPTEDEQKPEVAAHEG